MYMDLDKSSVDMHQTYMSIDGKEGTIEPIKGT